MSFSETPGVAAGRLASDMGHRAAPGTPPAPNPNVVSRRLGDGTVLVHLSTNTIFELNDTGARIWELLAERVTSDRIVDLLVSEFDVSRGQATLELRDLVARLRGEGLVEP